MPLFTALAAGTQLAGSLFGGSGDSRFNRKNAVFNPADISGGFGSLDFTQEGNFGPRTANFQQDPQTQAFMQQLIQSGGQGFLNDPNFQQALQGNNIAGSFQGAQQGLQQGFGNTAFGGLGGLTGGATGLANLFGQQTQAGPRDLSGAQSSLFGGGLQNLQNAGNTSGLIAQNLAASNALAAPGENRALNALQNREFSATRGATSGAGGREGQFVDQLLSAQNQRVLNAQSLGLQQQQQLGQIGLGQVGAGAGLFGQNLQNFQAGTGFAGQFAGQAAGFEGQQFGQNLTSQQQNISQGQQRLSNSLNLFGIGSGLQQQDFQAQGAITAANLAQNQFEVNTIQGAQNAEANRIGAAGQSANAIQQGAANTTAVNQGLFSGIADTLGLGGGGKINPGNFGGFLSEIPPQAFAPTPRSF